MEQYGLPYKGSKSKYAKRIFSIFPKRDNFYDLFCGGCAMTHYALKTKRFKKIVANDINGKMTQLFIDAINGKYHNEKRWISREEFEQRKGHDMYVACVWSFGNNGKDYIYGKDIEPLKKALHYAIVFNDYTLADELGIQLPRTDAKDLNKRRLDITKGTKKLLTDIGISDRREEMQNLERFERLEKLQSLQSLERFERLEKLQRTCLSRWLAVVGLMRVRFELLGVFGLTSPNYRPQCRVMRWHSATIRKRLPPIW